LRRRVLHLGHLHLSEHQQIHNGKVFRNDRRLTSLESLLLGQETIGRYLELTGD
jgi:hypothetical protein